MNIINKRLIIIIDLIEQAENLISYAYDFSKHTQAEILLIYQPVIPSPFLSDPETKKQFFYRTKAKTLSKLKKMIKELVPVEKRVWISIVETHIQTELEFHLKEAYENIIILGVNKISTFEKVFLGNFALKIIDSTQNTIITVPEQTNRFCHEKIFIAMTEQYPINRIELSKFLNFFNTENTQLKFFYLSRPNEKIYGIEEVLNKEAIFFSQKYQTSFEIYEGNKPFDDIKKVIKNKIEELLIVQKGSRLLTDQLFRKFIINELVNDGETPLVILP